MATTTETWQLEESSAEAYERYSVAAWSRPLAEELVELAAPAPGERVLDVACGTGIVARLAAERVGDGGAVTGVDLNEGMLAVAKAASAGIAAAIEWRQGDVEALPFADASFDLVTCQQGFQFFPDREAALRETARVIAPGGRLALSVLRGLDHHLGWRLLADALERHAGPEAGAMMRAPFPELDAAELRELAASAGLGDVRVRLVVTSARYPSARDVVRWEAAASPLAGPLGALTEERRQALVEDYAAAVRGYMDDDGVVFPQETWVVLARRPERAGHR